MGQEATLCRLDRFGLTPSRSPLRAGVVACRGVVTTRRSRRAPGGLNTPNADALRSLVALLVLGSVTPVGAWPVQEPALPRWAANMRMAHTERAGLGVLVCAIVLVVLVLMKMLAPGTPEWWVVSGTREIIVNYWRVGPSRYYGDESRTVSSPVGVFVGDVHGSSFLTFLLQRYRAERPCPWEAEQPTGGQVEELVDVEAGSDVDGYNMLVSNVTGELWLERVWQDYQSGRTRANDQLNGNNGEATNTDDLASAAGGGGPGAPTGTIRGGPVVRGRRFVRQADSRHKPARGSKNPRKQARPPSPSSSERSHVREGDERPICRHYLNGGCDQARRCRFRHPEEEANGQRPPPPGPLFEDYPDLPEFPVEAALVVCAPGAQCGDLVYYHGGSIKDSLFGEVVGLPAGRGFGIARMDGGRLMPVVAHGRLLQRVKEARHGTVVLHRDSDGSAMAQYCVFNAALPGYEGAAVDTPRRYRVHMHMLRAITERFSAGRVDTRDIETALAYLQRNWDLSRDARVMALARTTVDYMFAAQGLRHLGVRVLRNGLVAPRAADPIVAHPDVLPLLVRVDATPTGVPWVDQGAPTGPKPYMVRPETRCRVVSGCDRYDPEVVGTLLDVGVPIATGRDMPRLPTFNTLGESSKQFHTRRYFQVCGTGDEFQRPIHDTLEYYLALKRIVGRREQEDALRRGEAEFGYASRAAVEFRRSMDHTVDLEATVPGEKPSEFGVSFIGDWALPSGYRYPTSAATRSASWGLARCLREDVSRSKLRQLLDRVHTTVHVLGLCVKLASYSVQEFAYHNLAWMADFEETSQNHRERVAKVPHIKRALKEEYVRRTKVHVHDELMVSAPVIKMKNETKKAGAYSRLFTSLDAGSECAGLLPVMLKALLDGYRTYEVGAVTLITVTVLKPDREILRDAFRLALQARHTTNSVVVVHHGDDMLVSFNCGGVPYTTNLDISSCDTSNRRVMFTWLHAFMAALSPTGANALVAQARLPMAAVNPADPNERFMIWPDGPGGVAQPSGWVGTTIINTLATKAIAFAIAGSVDEMSRTSVRHLRDDPAHAEVAVVRAAAALGYEVKAKSCDLEGEFVPERMEFLRHAYDPETDQAFLCPSAVLRNLGSIDGPVTANRFGWTQEEFYLASHQQRMHRMVSGIVRGLVHEPPSALLDALRVRFADDSAPVPELGYSWALFNASAPGCNVDGRDVAASSVRLTSSPASAGAVDRAIVRRYALQDDEYEQLVDLLSGISVGQKASSHAAGKMYEFDYGLPNGEAAGSSAVWQNAHPHTNIVDAAMYDRAEGCDAIGSGVRVA